MRPTYGPLIPYYGAKWRSSHWYPAPQSRRIVEPFAGAAGYALRFCSSATVVELSDASRHISAAWNLLLSARYRPEIIRQLPAAVESVDDVPEYARALIGFWLNPGSATPKRTPSKRGREGDGIYFAGSVWSAKTRDRIASDMASLPGEWWFTQRDWRETLDALMLSTASTVFVDPPYQGTVGRYYPGKWTTNDYEQLGDACLRLAERHQVIVCERQGATWLPFQPLHVYHGSYRNGMEVIWAANMPGTLIDAPSQLAFVA
jgi:hypothetical protein